MDLRQSASYMQPEIVKATVGPLTPISGLPQVHNFSSAPSTLSLSSKHLVSVPHPTHAQNSPLAHIVPKPFSEFFKKPVTDTLAWHNCYF